jgi:hypothetical protein
VNYRAWVAAIKDVDKRGDKTALLRLLRDGPEPSRVALHHIADLIDRHTLARPQGRPRQPSYTSTHEQWMTNYAVAQVRAAVEIEKMPVAEAVDAAARSLGVPAKALESAYRGKTGALRRINRRKAPA